MIVTLPPVFVDALISFVLRGVGKMDIDFPIDSNLGHPYRSSQKVEKKVNKRRAPNKLPGAAEIVFAVINLNLAGFIGEYLNRSSDYLSCSGLFCATGFVVLALFFGYRGWIKSAHSLNRFRR